jgi:rod shape-determining protein MreD
MKPSPLQRIDHWVRHSAPVALTLALVMISVVPTRLPGYSVVAPSLTVMSLFYWTVHRPDLMRVWAAFAIGLLEDSLSGTPLGVNALLYVLIHAAILAQYRVFRGKSFGLIWAAFAVIAAFAQLMTAILAAVVGGALIPAGVYAAQLILTILIYPVVAWLMGRAQRAFLATV